jgi:hypothetical protein
VTAYELSYALPVSCIGVDGTVTHTVDRVLDTTDRLPEVAVTLHVHGIVRNQTLRIRTGALRDTSVSFELQQDGRLRSTSAESTGQLGRTLLGVAGAGAALAAVVTGAGPVAGLAGAATAGIVGGREIAGPDRLQPREQTPEQKVATAYRLAHREVAEARERYGALIDRASEELAAAVGQVLAGEGATSMAEVRRLRAVLKILRAEIAPLNEHFKAWRATTIGTRTERHQRCFSLDALRAARVEVGRDTVAFAGVAEAAVRAAWTELGVVVTMDPPGQPVADAESTRQNAIVVRYPRRVRLAVYEKVDGRPVLREERPHLVVDAASETGVVPLRRSLWARRSVGLKFGELGVLTSYAQGSTSSLAAIGDTAGALPAAIAGGLEQGAKLDAAHLDAQLDMATTRVKLKQQELAAAGLAATEADYAELRKLKQEAAMATARKTIQDGG